MVANLAWAVHDEHAFDRLPVLADALLDAGCDDPALLGHCRGPGEHARGCWAVDLLLGEDRPPQFTALRNSVARRSSWSMRSFDQNQSRPRSPRSSSAADGS